MSAKNSPVCRDSLLGYLRIKNPFLNEYNFIVIRIGNSFAQMYKQITENDYTYNFKENLLQTLIKT